MKRVQCFGRQRKLTLMYIGLFMIVERSGAASYRLDLPASMSSIHSVFHVLMLKKHLRNEEQQRVLDTPKIKLHDDLTTIEIPICILVKEDKRLRNNMITLVKVQWNWKGAKEGFKTYRRAEGETMHFLSKRDLAHVFEELQHIVEARSSSSKPYP
uniref:Putative retrotransposon protein, related n=1 Tax=Asparagus officinalis TaxID=4686 RepID=Q2AA61_ASPOF|nr:Putative retrotransposon protein, related [Asparagus officinalis]